MARNMHPILSIVKIYDFSMARLTRMFIMLLQISLVTIIVYVLFSEKVTAKIEENLPENVFKYHWVIFSFLLAFLLLPPPNFFLNMFRNVIVSRKSENFTANSSDEKEKDETVEDATEVIPQCSYLKTVITV